MKVAEAYSILEIPVGASPEEAKKKYRELTKKYHPDVNKDPGAEDKFKKINEAYQVISTGKSTDREDVVSRSRTYNPFGDSPFGRSTIYEATHVQAQTTISFLDSVWGTKKEIKLSRRIKCVDCGGQGEKAINNGCAECGGRGQVVNRRNNTIMITPCTKCHGETKVEQCKTCAASGAVDTESSVQVTIPGGIVNGSTLRLGGMGNFAGTFMLGIDQYTDALLYINVIPEQGLTLENPHVISTIEISLLEAIKGCNKKVKTIVGQQNIEIKPMSRNGDIISIKGMGVNRVGDQRVILDVKYPEDINKLINILEEKD